jgi:hypothetical protein
LQQALKKHFSTNIFKVKCYLAWNLAVFNFSRGKIQFIPPFCFISFCSKETGLKLVSFVEIGEK